MVTIISWVALVGVGTAGGV